MQYSPDIIWFKCSIWMNINKVHEKTKNAVYILSYKLNVFKLILVLETLLKAQGSIHNNYQYLIIF